MLIGHFSLIFIINIFIALGTGKVKECPIYPGKWLILVYKQLLWQSCRTHADWADMSLRWWRNLRCEKFHSMEWMPTLLWPNHILFYDERWWLTVNHQRKICHIIIKFRYNSWEALVGLLTAPDFIEFVHIVYEIYVYVFCAFLRGVIFDAKSLFFPDWRNEIIDRTVQTIFTSHRSSILTYLM